jgi:seryl-tRNA synthetase
MSDLTELQQRVEQAEQRFGSIGTQHAKYSARLIDLMDQIERQASERQQEIEGFAKEIARIRNERDQIKTMLQDLLHAIEAGSHEVLNETLRELDNRASAILGETTTPDAPAGTVVPFTGRFEDVSAAELEAEIQTETAVAAPQEPVAVESEVSAAVASETDYEPKLPTAMVDSAIATLGESPVAEIIERISLLTRALIETRTPSAEAKAKADETETVEDEVRRIA